MSLFDKNTSLTVSHLVVLGRLLESEEIKQKTLNQYSIDYLQTLVTVAIAYERYASLNILLTHLGCPSDLTLKEKIAYYQLLMEK